jgi:hypothetical protein
MLLSNVTTSLRGSTEMLQLGSDGAEGLNM